MCVCECADEVFGVVVGGRCLWKKWGSQELLYHMDVVFLPPLATDSTITPTHTHAQTNTHFPGILMSNTDHLIS